MNTWRFPNLRGSVLWVPDRLEITNTTADLYGGTTRFDYRMAPFGKPGVPARATWDVDYRGVDLSRLTDFLEVKGLRLAGSATGKNRLEWPLGKWALKTGRGEVTLQPPPGVKPMTRELQADVIARVADLPELAGPFNSHLSLGYKPVAGHIVYSLDPDWIVLDDSWAATESTYVQFQGRTAFGERSEMPFHVTSLDWQESDRVLAGIMTTFGAPTGAVPIDGNGEFDGRMLASFSKPRIEGTFKGDRLRAWDVIWGRGIADVVIENSYAIVANAILTSGESEIRADGQFSLGYPRKDHGEEIDARIRLNRRPLADLRHAFQLDDYPMEGLVSGDFHLYGAYEGPFGFGKMAIDQGVAYGETFERATSSLRFEGNGVRLDTLEMRKSTGTVTGAAFVGWEGDYSFNADGTRIPVESLRTVAFPQAPLSGLLQFSASGAGTFEEPKYDVKLRGDDLFAGDEGIGQLNGRLSLRGELLNLEMEAASPRLVGLGFRAHRAHARDGRRAQRAICRHIARPVRALLRATPLAVHERRRGRYAPGRRRARGRRPPRRRNARREPRLEAVRLQVEEHGHDRSLAGPVTSSKSTSSGSREKGPSCRFKDRSRSIETRSRSRHPEMAILESCRASTVISAAAAPPQSRRKSAVRSTSRCSPEAQTSPTAASGCCRSPTRSRRSTAGSRSTPTAFAWTTCPRVSAKGMCGSAAGSGSRALRSAI